MSTKLMSKAQYAATAAVGLASLGIMYILASNIRKPIEAKDTKPKVYPIEEKYIDSDNFRDLVIRGPEGRIIKVFLGTDREDTYREVPFDLVYKLQAQEDSLEGRLK